jgi:hypothetical protein
LLNHTIKFLPWQGFSLYGGEAKTHGSKLTDFLSFDTIKPFVNNELPMAVNEPVRFIRPGRGGFLRLLLRHYPIYLK